MKRYFQMALSLCIAMGCLFFAHAQEYSIDWSTVDGGGGTSTGGVYAVSGTVGQPDAGGMSGGAFSLNGGFWEVLAVQTIGAPLLSISAAGANALSITWPSPSTGWVLQQNTNSLMDAGGWSDITSNIQDNGSVMSLTITPTAKCSFYRLR